MITYLNPAQVPKHLLPAYTESRLKSLKPNEYIVWLSADFKPDANMTCLQYGKNCTCTKEKLNCWEKIFIGKRECSWYILTQ